MNNALMGLETEYAFTLLGRGEHTLDKKYYAESLLTLAAQHYPALYGRDEYDLFLANGSRIYVDHGMGLLNLEYSTPECTSPQELVAQVRAGDRIFAGLARKLERKHAGLQSAFISKTNIDYCGHTSGSHENYLHSAPQALLPPHLIPHLVSRVIYTGSGGFDETAPNIEFMLSPRVRFLKHEISNGAQSDRAIFTTRQEPMSNSRFGRLHLLCGEGVRYDMCEYLRFGVTALILRLVDAGLNPGQGIEMNPLEAIDLVARDIHCKVRIGLLNGVPVSAIDLQRHYLHQVQAQLGASILPHWAEQLCRRWQATLDGLESGPENMAGILDWPTRLGLYRAFAEQKGYHWQDLTSNVDKPRCAMRARLFEFDIRLGDIADDGLFAMLGKDMEGGSQFVSEQDIVAALSTPPPNSRAALRGKWISRLSEQRNRLTCDWSRIFDRVVDQSLLFDDPLGSSTVNWVSD